MLIFLAYLIVDLIVDLQLPMGSLNSVDLVAWLWYAVSNMHILLLAELYVHGSSFNVYNNIANVCS